MTGYSDEIRRVQGGNVGGGAIARLLARGGLLSLVLVAILAGNLVAPAHGAKNPKNYQWTDVQIFAATAGCGNSVWVSRFDARGTQLGTKQVLRPKPGVQLVPKAFDFRSSSNERNFVFSTFDCGSNRYQLWAWDLARGSRPQMVVDFLPGETLMDAEIDLASGDILFIRWSAAGTITVEIVSTLGGNSTILWTRQASPIAISPTRIMSYTGGEYAIVGRLSAGGWGQVELSTRRSGDAGALRVVGPGEISSVTEGASGLTGTTNVFTNRSDQGWICPRVFGTPFSANAPLDVSQDSRCQFFRPVQTVAGPQVSWAEGARGPGLLWEGSGQNYLQWLSRSPTEAYSGSDLVALRANKQNRTAVSGQSLVVAWDINRAIDAIPFSSFQIP